MCGRKGANRICRGGIAGEQKSLASATADVSCTAVTTPARTSRATAIPAGQRGGPGRHLRIGPILSKKVVEGHGVSTSRKDKYRKEDKPNSGAHFFQLTRSQI